MYYFENSNNIQDSWELGTTYTGVNGYKNNGTPWSNIYHASGGCTAAFEGSFHLWNGSAVKQSIAQVATCGGGTVVTVAVGGVGVSALPP